MKLLVVLVAIFALTLLYTPQQASGNRAAIAAIPKLLAAAGIEPPGAARHQAPTSRATSSSGGCAVTTSQTAQGAQWTESNYVYQVYDLAVTNAGGVIITDVQLSITLASDAAFAQSWGIDAVQGSATRYKLTNWGGIQAGATQSAGYIVRAPLASGVSAPVVVVESATCADGSAYHPPSPSPSPVPSPATSTLPKIPTNAECPPTYYTESYWKANGGLSRHLIGSWEGIGKFSVVDKASGVVLQALDVDDTWTVVYNHSTGGLYWIDNFLIVGDLSPGPADYFDRYLQAPGRTCTHQTETPIDNNVGKEYDFEDALQLSTLVDRNTGELTMSCSYKFEPGWTRVQVDCALFDNMVNYVPAGMLVQYHIYMVKQS